MASETGNIIWQIDLSHIIFGLAYDNEFLYAATRPFSIWAFDKETGDMKGSTRNRAQGCPSSCPMILTAAENGWVVVVSKKNELTVFNVSN